MKQDINSIHLRTGRPGDSADREAVATITRTAFLVNPETGVPIEGDTPKELPMVQALFDRSAVDHLHLAVRGDQVVGYVLYTRGTLTGNPGVHVQGLTIMGIAPRLQRQGIGTRLLLWSVRQMRGSCDALFVLGHPRFYPLAGFEPSDALGISFSFPAPREACMMAPLGDRPLLPGVLSYHPIVHEFF